MDKANDNTDGQLLFALQKGIPLEERPFQALGNALSMDEDRVIEKIRGLFDEGIARRFGAIFDSHSLGYKSSLCAIDVPQEDLEKIAGLLSPHPGITHSYQRSGEPNLWFTLTASADEMDDELKRIAEAIAPLELLNLPAIKKFKVQVLFDTAGTKSDPAPDTPSPPADAVLEPKHFNDMSAQEKVVMGHLEGSLDVTRRPFDVIAADAGYDAAQLMEMLTAWKAAGMIRRIAVILRHHKIGYTANGMCVWNAEKASIAAAGSVLASCKEVSHCYERVVNPGFPYNLFAMIHADARDAAERLFETISEKAGLTGGKIMFSVREFKKSSMIYVGKR